MKVIDFVLPMLLIGVSALELQARQTSSAGPAAVGSVAAGQRAYLEYRCYACHGYDAQTGNGQRLLPPRLSQPLFTRYLRAPRTRQMPTYSAAVLSDAEAEGIYVFVTSLPQAPEVKDVPLLRQLPSTAQDDLFTGTWRLNLARSTMNPATASRSELIHYRVTGNEEEFITEAVTIKGEPESITYRARYDDGKPYPITTTVGDQVRSAETMVKRVDRLTRERYNVRDGKPIIASRRVVSKDGRTLTLTILRLDAQGQETIAETRVFDKQ